MEAVAEILLFVFAFLIAATALVVGAIALDKALNVKSETIVVNPTVTGGGSGTIEAGTSIISIEDFITWPLNDSVTYSKSFVSAPVLNSAATWNQNGFVVTSTVSAETASGFQVHVPGPWTTLPASGYQVAASVSNVIQPVFREITVGGVTVPAVVYATTGFDLYYTYANQPAGISWVTPVKVNTSAVGVGIVRSFQFRIVGVKPTVMFASTATGLVVSQAASVTATTFAEVPQAAAVAMDGKAIDFMVTDTNNLVCAASNSSGVNSITIFWATNDPPAFVAQAALIGSANSIVQDGIALGTVLNTGQHFAIAYIEAVVSATPLFFATASSAYDTAPITWNASVVVPTAGVVGAISRPLSLVQMSVGGTLVPAVSAYDSSNTRQFVSISADASGSVSPTGWPSAVNSCSIGSASTGTHDAVSSQGNLVMINPSVAAVSVVGHEIKTGGSGANGQIFFAYSDVTTAVAMCTTLSDLANFTPVDSGKHTTSAAPFMAPIGGGLAMIWFADTANTTLMYWRNPLGGLVVDSDITTEYIAAHSL